MGEDANVCGIAGILRMAGPGPNRALLREMIARIRYRGPDESGVHVDGPVGLGHCRLSIIDLAAGQQPMHSADGSRVLVFNGEIFNHVELRADLERRGHRFRTHSDTEAILHVYEAYGEDGVHALNGQWAFALWDKPAGKLFLSRDRLGIRPLHYAQAGGDFLFASEIKSLFAHPALPREADLEALDDIFTFWTTTRERTFFRGVSELPPGHSLSVTPGGMRKRAYWQIGYPEIREPASVAAAAEELLELLKDSVRLRLRSDVPVGAYLSGGIDSTLATALIRHFTDNPLETFSVTFSDADYDESFYQKAAVESLRTRHAQIQCTGQEIGRVFPEVVWHAEKPLIRTAPAPLYLLSGLVRRHDFKVVLTGEGADEVFGGYDIFKEAKIRRFWCAAPDSPWRPLLLHRLYPYMNAVQAQSTDYLKSFFHVRPEDVASPFFSHLPRWELTARLKGLFSGPVKEALRGRDALDVLRGELPEAYPRWPPFCQSQYLETAYLLPGYILSSQGDRMAMAHSVEGRFPFLDHRVVTFAASLPPRLKMRGLHEKFLLKETARGLVPEPVLRRPKQPYRAPDVPSFFLQGGRGSDLEYVRELLSPGTLEDFGIFDPRAVSALVRKCQQGRFLGVRDNMAFVGVLSTQLAVDQFVRKGGERPPPPAAGAPAAGEG